MGMGMGTGTGMGMGCDWDGDRDGMGGWKWDGMELTDLGLTELDPELGTAQPLFVYLSKLKQRRCLEIRGYAWKVEDMLGARKVGV